MKVTLNWLKQYVEFDWAPEELAERLTMIGIEVEGMQKVAGEFEGIVVAQVLIRDKVTGSDKLSVCRVKDGKGERQIICGAQNFKAGDKVALILPNFALPLKPGDKEPFVIKVRKVMGVESHGMLCSPQELGLADQIDGILILREDARPGQPFAEYLGRTAGDVVYDLEITPNRPDLNSVIGIAREISAVTGEALRMPDAGELVVAGGGEKADDLMAVRIEDAELCPRYTVRVVRGVKIGPSPDWLKTTLEKVGMRSISNVVDVTNFVMLECGQPLHAFDYQLLAKGNQGKPTIVVRRASEGERFTTLDGEQRTLTNQMLLIADETKAVALAGIMGGQNTEINDRTVDVLIESAYFKPQNIRATSKKLGLRSESSYRFERGGDIGICEWASRRAAQLIMETAGGVLADGVVDAYPHPVSPRQIELRHHKPGELLGVKISSAQNVKYLEQLGLKITADNPGQYCLVEVPSFRADLKREVDLIEEITRMHGVERVPATPPRGAIGSNPFDAMHDQLAEARRILTGLGLHEAQGQTLVSDKAAGVEGAIALANPLSSEMNVLRPSLLPGLLETLRHNVSRKNNEVALFEIGRVFTPSNGQAEEERRLAVALTGPRNPLFWSGQERDALYDIYDLKGFVEEFFEQFGVRGVSFARRPASTALFLESALVRQGKLSVGELGQLLPAVAKRYDLRDGVLLAELNLDLLLKWRNPDREFKPLPAFPAIRRDVAMLAPEATTHEAVLNAVRQAKPANLETVQLFDVYRGRNIPAGQKSMAYAFTYRSPERTLTDAEVSTAHEKLGEQLKRNLQATLREG
jgi:phenylalanyl-tRNA synthetase beta chain